MGATDLCNEVAKLEVAIFYQVWKITTQKGPCKVAIEGLNGQ